MAHLVINIYCNITMMTLLVFMSYLISSLCATICPLSDSQRSMNAMYSYKVDGKEKYLKSVI